MSLLANRYNVAPIAPGQRRFRNRLDTPDTPYGTPNPLVILGRRLSEYMLGRGVNGMLVHAGEPGSLRRDSSRNALLVAVAGAIILAGFVAFLRLGGSIAPTPLFAPVRTPDFGKLPLAFEPNVGQADPGALYLARSQGANLAFTRSGVDLSVAQPAEEASQVRLLFLGANPSVSLNGGIALAGKSNYMLGHDSTEWYTDVPNYSEINYRDLYRGVNLNYTGHAGTLKGTYTIAPGADPSRILWRYDSATQVKVDEAGNLQIGLGKPDQRLVEQAPVAWQEINGKRVPVHVNYRVGADGIIGFTVGNYDRAHTLVIDPVLSYSTYLGGTADDIGYDIAVSPSGEIYVTGFTQSLNFPTSNARQPSNAGGSDVFVTKFNSTGNTLLFSTYLGGNGHDEARGIALGFTGDAYITGKTASTNFPTTPGAYQPNFRGGIEVFVSRLSANGSALVYSTYLSGTGNEEGHAIALDYSNNIYVTGFTTSANFPTANAYQPAMRGVQDAFLSKFSSDGTTLVYSTYFGGSQGLGGNYDDGLGVAADAGNNAYVTGFTGSTDFPTVNPIQATNRGNFDAFAAKFNPIGGVLYSTYLGGVSGDEGHGIALDLTGAAYIVGTTFSPDYPTASAYQPTNQGGGDAFITKINPAGSALALSTFLGGSGYDYGWGIAVDSYHNVFVTGQTGSSNFPTANPVQASLSGQADIYVSNLAGTGQAMIYSTYLGGDNYEHSFGIDVDEAGAAYVTGDTYSPNFPVVGPYQPNQASHIDAFVAKIGAPQAVTPTSTPTTRPSNTPVPATMTPRPSTTTPTPGTCDMTFSDVQPSDYFYGAVRYLYCNGIITGYVDDTFRPYNNTTRGQLSKIAVLAMGWDVDCPEMGHFSDVPFSHTFYCYIETAFSHGIISGYGDGTFRSDNNVTRGQLSKIVVQAMQWTDECPASGHFSDVPVGSPFFCFVETAFAHNIINGYGDGTFRPDNSATRGQISKIVYEAIIAP